jgi:hypothetical protein
MIRYALHLVVLTPWATLPWSVSWTQSLLPMDRHSSCHVLSLPGRLTCLLVRRLLACLHGLDRTRCRVVSCQVRESHMAKSEHSPQLTSHEGPNHAAAM